MALERPSFPSIYMTLAEALAGRSTCRTDRVGCVITSVDFRKVLAIGYRGNATGLPNRCDREGEDCGCLHAEENAVIHCDAPRGEPKIVLTSKLPCRACAKRLINLGGVQDLYVPGDAAIPDGPSASGRSGGQVVDLFGMVGIRVHPVAREPVSASRWAEKVRPVDPKTPSPDHESGRLAGTVLGNYRLGELLGEGGMAEVYRARDRKTKQAVAIKVLIEARAMSQKSFRERFEREWRVMQAVTHPHVVALLDWPDPPTGPMYFAMELLEGETLSQRLDRDERLPLELACQLFTQLAQGLAAVHAAGIIHRDIKPLNIFLCHTPDGSINAKILDFGLARVLGSAITGVGLVVGTPAYVAPEQASGDKIDHRVDIYALGLVMYRAITGQHPFKSDVDDQVTTLGHQLLSPPPPLSWLEEAIPRRLEALVLQMLRKRPEDRPQTIQAVVDELGDIESEGTPVPSEAPMQSRPSNPPGDRYGPLNPLAESLVRTALVSKGFREKKS